MDISSTIQLIVLVILLALSAFFSSSETALTTVNRIRMRSLAEEGNKRAARVLQVTDDSAKMLSAILIGNNVVDVYKRQALNFLSISDFLYLLFKVPDLFFSQLPQVPCCTA